MELVVEAEPESAWRQAKTSGVLVVPYEAEFAEEEWLPFIEDWQHVCRAYGRASIVIFVDRDPKGAIVSFDDNGVPSFAGPRLDAAMRRLLEDTVNCRGYGDGAFTRWMTRLLPFGKAGRVVAKARRLDRFARDAAGARAFEGGRKDIIVWGVHSL